MENVLLNNAGGNLFNYLCASLEETWNRPSWNLDQPRFCQYSVQALRERFEPLTPALIDELKSYPALFAYEGNSLPVRLGYITNIKKWTNTVYCEYKFVANVPPISPETFIPLRDELDISRPQITRTHWAVKDVDLLAVLKKARIVRSNFTMPNDRVVRLEDVHFDAAVSFPGERRQYVKSVVQNLRMILPEAKIFYDKDWEAQLARPAIDVLFQRIYKDSSDLVVTFMCAEYERKRWCGIEWRAIRNLIHDKRHHALMLLRLDKAEIDGLLPNDGYLDVSKVRPEITAQHIADRIRLNWADKVK